MAISDQCRPTMVAASWQSLVKSFGLAGVVLYMAFVLGPGGVGCNYCSPPPGGVGVGGGVGRQRGCFAVCVRLRRGHPDACAASLPPSLSSPTRGEGMKERHWRGPIIVVKTA